MKTLNPTSSIGINTNVLKALERRSSSQGHGCDRAGRYEESHQSIFHRSRAPAYQGLVLFWGSTLVPPTGLRVPLERENRPDTMVGRLHYSLSSSLSAQFRWGVGASERLNFSS